MLNRVILLVFLLTPLASAEDVWTGVDRIVAVGDVHGDYDQFIAVLRHAGVIDEDEKWSGGQTHFVQTGDVPDRGPDTRKILDLLKDLEKQAKKAGGQVHPLIGNHEAMNMYGDLRYVTTEEFQAFSSVNSRRLQERAYDVHVERIRRSPPAGGLPTFGPVYEQEWKAEHPLGYVEHRQAYSQDGEYGRWIRKNNAVIQINDTIFMHGGWSPKYADWEIEALNKQIHDELEDFSKLRGGVTVDSEGPLWYRGLAQGDQTELTPHLDTLLARLGAKRIVMGHTPTIGTVFPRFGGKALLIDVGLSETYGGRMACLVIENGVPYTLHRSKRIDLPADGSVEELYGYLSAAAALDPDPSPLASTLEGLAPQIESK